MLSIGCDIEDIARFKNKSLENDEVFLKKIFTSNELKYCFEKKNPSQHLAARFCAKEATIKAITNISNKFIPYSKIEILNNENKAPYITIYDEEFKLYNILVSLSHEKEKAMAFVAIENKKE